MSHQSNTNAHSQLQHMPDDMAPSSHDDPQNNTSPQSDNLLMNKQSENPEPEPEPDAAVAVVVAAGGGNNENKVEIPPNPQQSKRRRYNRHTPEQKQQMEMFFKECPHPDEKQRRELGRLVGLNSLQIKFWFQNKRTQVKNLQERSENDELRAENQELRAANESYKQILDNTLCLDCGGPPPPPHPNFEEQRLIAENTLLRQEIEKVKKMIENLCMKVPQTYNPNMPTQHNIDMAGTSLNNEGVENVEFQHKDMPPPNSVSEGLVGNLADNNMPESLIYEGLGNLPSQVNYMPSSSFFEGLNNLSSQDNYMLPSFLNEGLSENLQSQDNHMLLSSVNQAGFGDVAFQYNNNNNNIMPSNLSLTQGIANISFQQNNNTNMPSFYQGIDYNMPSQHNNSMPSSLINHGVGGAQLSGIAGKMTNGVVGGSDPLRSSLPLLANRYDKPLIMKLAVESLQEFTMLALAENNQIWVLGDYNAEILNAHEYFRTFRKGIGPKPLGFNSESSRESMVVPMNHISLIEILMDVAQWSRVFSGIVTRAETLEFVSKGLEGSYDGCVQVMSAEFQVPSTFVPPREYNFLRYCKQLQGGSWAVVDVSLDTIRPSATTVLTTRRRPSGCLIQALPNGFSTKVTWVEHVEVNDKALEPHRIYKPLVDSGYAFGAKRWMSLLDRQCERIATTLVTHIPHTHIPQRQLAGGILTNREVRKALLKVAERMVKSFHIGVGASTPEGWTTLTSAGSGSNTNIRIITRKVNNEPGLPNGIVIGVATSFRIAASRQRVFDCIRNENFRTQWDILAAGGIVQQVGRIENGRDPANCVSILRVESSNPTQSNLIILQESCTDSTGSVVVFSPLEKGPINALMGGQHPDTIPMLPSGLAIFPDAGSIVQAESGGCLATLTFQIMIESDITKKLSICSVSSVTNLLKNTIERIKAMVNCNST